MSYKNNYLPPGKLLSKTDIKNMKKHLLILKKNLCFDDSQICTFRFNFLHMPSPDISRIQMESFIFLALLHLKHNAPNSAHHLFLKTHLSISSRNHHAVIYLSLYLVVGSPFSFSYCWFFLPEDWDPSLHGCFNCSPLSRSIV